MFECDLTRLKLILRNHRRSRHFQAQFPQLIMNKPSKSYQPLSQQFQTKFIKIHQHKQLLPYRKKDQLSYLMLQSRDSNITAQQSDAEPHISQLNERQQYLFNKNMKSKNHNNLKNPTNYPIKCNNTQIAKICHSFEQMKKQDFNHQSEDMFQRLFTVYSQQQAGSMSYQQFKQKIETDILYLVERQSKKLIKDH